MIGKTTIKIIIPKKQVSFFIHTKSVVYYNKTERVFHHFQLYCILPDSRSFKYVYHMP